MVKRLSILMILTVLSLGQIQNSQAGVVISQATGQPLFNVWDFTISIGAGLGAAGGVIYTSKAELDPFWMLVTVPMGMTSGAIIGAILDAPTGLSEERLVDLFEAKFPFVDSSEVIANLAKSTREKVKERTIEVPAQEGFTVSFDEDEVRSIFSATDLSDAQLGFVIHELQ